MQFYAFDRKPSRRCTPINPPGNSVSDYISSLICSLRASGKDRTAETYSATLRSFMRFRHGVDMPICQLDAIVVENYQTFLFGTGLAANTVSFYMRNLRAAYYRAMDEAGIYRNEIFRHVYTGIGRTAKRALDSAKISCIKNLDLTDNPDADLARDLFMFSFYTRGMSFVDMAYLKKSNLTEGVLHYRRRKTGQTMRILWENDMQKIIDKHPTESSPYLLPILQISSTSERSQYRGQHTKINRALKTVARKAGIKSNLTTYVARHSWASIAKAKNVPISIISEGMGHESERVTRIYLATLDSSAVDNANRMIIMSI